MLALARFLILAGVFLSVVYGALWLYLRARRKEILSQEHNPAEHGNKEAWIDGQMPAFNQRRTRFLLWAVFVFPLCIVALIVYLTNYH